MSKPLPTDLPILPFTCAADFESFLDREHQTAPGIHIKLAKKASGIPSISGAEAVETALCYGWIDGRANSVDADWWLVRYTPRRAKSIWSKKNVDTVERLLKDGRMRPAGIAAVEAAKADGRWDRAYAGPASICVPEDFSVALSGAPTAASFFNSLNKSDRYSVLWRIETASPTSRPGRVEALVQMLSIGKLPGTAKDKGKTLQPKKAAASVTKVTKSSFGTRSGSRSK